MPPARPECLALLSAHAAVSRSLPYPVSFPAALCAWHMLPNSCGRTPTIPQVTHAVDKIVVAPAGRFWLAQKKPGLRLLWIGYIGRLNDWGGVPPRRFERPTHG